MKKEWGITIAYTFLFLGAGMAVYLGLWFMPSKISEQGVNLWNELALPNEAKEVFTTSFEVFKKTVEFSWMDQRCRDHFRFRFILL